MWCAAELKARQQQKATLKKGCDWFFERDISRESQFETSKRQKSNGTESVGVVRLMPVPGTLSGTLSLPFFSG